MLTEHRARSAFAVPVTDARHPDARQGEVGADNGLPRFRFPTAADSCDPFGMIEQKTRVPCVNRAERIRYRAWLHVQRTRDYEAYWRLVNLSLEAHLIR